jgi:hypothetical protein
MRATILIGRFGDYPPTDEKSFFEFAEELHSPVIYQLLQQAERLTNINHFRFPTSIRRHYERLDNFPEGFLPLGDAVCSFNPIYAQGMSAAALQARALQQILADCIVESRRVDGIAPTFFGKVVEINDSPWVLAAAFDFAYPQTRGERPPGMEQRARYFAALDRLQSEDVEIKWLMAGVFQLTQPLSVLHEEPLRSRVLARMQA